MLAILKLQNKKMGGFLVFQRREVQQYNTSTFFAFLHFTCKERASCLSLQMRFFLLLFEDVQLFEWALVGNIHLRYYFNVHEDYDGFDF